MASFVVVFPALPVTPTTCSAPILTRPGAELLQRGQRIVHQQLIRRADCSFEHHCRCALLRGGPREIVTVVIRAA